MLILVSEVYPLNREIIAMYFSSHVLPIIDLNNFTSTFVVFSRFPLGILTMSNHAPFFLVSIL